MSREPKCKLLTWPISHLLSRCPVSPDLLQTIPARSRKEGAIVSALWCSYTSTGPICALKAMGSDEYPRRYMQGIALEM